MISPSVYDDYTLFRLKHKNLPKKIRLRGRRSELTIDYFLFTISFCGRWCSWPSAAEPKENLLEGKLWQRPYTFGGKTGDSGAVEKPCKQKNNLRFQAGIRAKILITPLFQHPHSHLLISGD